MVNNCFSIILFFFNLQNVYAKYFIIYKFLTLSLLVLSGYLNNINNTKLRKIQFLK